MGAGVSEKQSSTNVYGQTSMLYSIYYPFKIRDNPSLGGRE